MDPQQRLAVLRVLREHGPMWDSPERIARVANVPLDATKAALEALWDEGLAACDGELWLAEGELPREAKVGRPGPGVAIP